MATNTSFKIQCPSCEAMIPIRDPNLVGKKTDCPKCKYRFVVEEPDGDEDGPRPKAAKGKAKAKKGGNNMLILGSVLGGVALIVLGVVAYMIFFADSGTPTKKPITPIATNTPPVSPPTAPVTPAGDTTNNSTPAATVPAVPAPPDAAMLDPGTQTPAGEISNLLPNDTQSVLAINMDRFRTSTMGHQAFESPIGFRPDTFKNGFGLGVEEIAWLIRAENIGLNWSFNVFKTHRPVTLAELQMPLGLKKGPKTIMGRNYFVIAPNPLLDHLGTILQSELETRDAKSPARKNNSAEPLTLVQLDETTLVVAQKEVMEEFLQNNAQPALKSKMVGAEGGAAPAPTIPDRGGRGGRVPGPAAGDGGAQFADKNSYLTVDPALKAMLDRIEQDRDNIVLSMAQRLQSDPAIVNRLRDATGYRQLDVAGMSILGVGLEQLSNEKAKGDVAVEFMREQTAKDFEDQLKQVMPSVGQYLGLYLGGLQIQVDGAGGGVGGPGVRFGPGGSGPPRGVPAGPAGNTEDTKSSMKLERKGKVLHLNVDLSLNDRAYERIYGLSQGFVMRAKGMVDMSSGAPRYYELSAAGIKYRTEPLTKEGKELKPAATYPKGTFERDDSAGRLSRSWPPSQRVSWMVGLLPYLGYQEIYDGIDLKQSWRTEANVKQGSVLIPAFLNPRYPRPTWRAHPPSMGIRDLGATHFLGVAGVGMDAADYSMRDESVAKKIGVFGYNRQTSVKDITDGLSNTVYMIQVRPDEQRPWIAGGGATVTGIPETHCIEPFATTQGGKRGTYVLMCDGSVRFVKDDISDEVFKAMCTIRGGEQIPNLDGVAPKEKPPKGSSFTTVNAGSASPGGQ